MAARYLRSTGQVLQLGTVADGEFLKRSGTSLIGGTDQLPAVLSHPTASQTLAAGEYAMCGVPMTWDAGLSLTMEAGAVLEQRIPEMKEPAGMVLLATATASSSATIDFTLTGWTGTPYTNSDFAAYMVVLDHVAPATDGVILWVRLSTDGGVTFDAGATNYRSSGLRWNSTAVAPGGSTGAANIILTGTTMGNAANEDYSGKVLLINPAAADQLTLLAQAQYSETAGGLLGESVSARRAANGPVDAVRFLMSSGNITSGTFKLYGIFA